MLKLNQKYRTHMCGALREDHINNHATLSGWLHRKRDHGQLLFLDIRDSSGVTQCVLNKEKVTPDLFRLGEELRAESVITITGKVVAREGDWINDSLPTGRVEIQITDIKVITNSEELPFPVFGSEPCSEEQLLTYRFLALRKEKLASTIVLRHKLISLIRRHLEEKGFMEFQTPILTAASPEGARDFLVPSRLHQGRCYALPQAPQLFKQLIMIGGFDKYFQISPCFRDEDSRADRSAEFYQLDLEMAFVEQEDIFALIEDLMGVIWKTFAKEVSTPFQRITYQESLDKYGTDKPDLRNPLVLENVTDIFEGSDFKLFANAKNDGKVVLALAAQTSEAQPRSFFDNLNNWAREQGAGGLGYLIIDNKGEAKGPISKFMNEKIVSHLKDLPAPSSASGATSVDGEKVVFFICDKKKFATNFAGLARTKIADELSLINEDDFKFCWITDFPLFDKDEDTGQIQFSHNPFSMPQGGLDALSQQDPLDIKAYQYDLVCNGVELSSGAIRNHDLPTLHKAFEIAGHEQDSLKKKFSGLYKGLHYGAPPHGGIAPGIERMIMLLSKASNIREVMPFPLDPQARDLLMNAPSATAQEALHALGLKPAKVKPGS